MRKTILRMMKPARKLDKSSLDELREIMPVLSSEEQSTYVAGGPTYTPNGTYCGWYGGDDIIYVYEGCDFVPLSQASEYAKEAVMGSIVLSELGYSGTVSSSGISSVFSVTAFSGAIQSFSFSSSQLYIVQNYYDMRSAMFHEQAHASHHCFGYTPEGVVISKARVEDTVYSQQVQDDSFISTTSGFKEFTASSWYNECSSLPEYAGKDVDYFRQKCGL